MNGLTVTGVDVTNYFAKDKHIKTKTFFRQCFIKKYLRFHHLCPMQQFDTLIVGQGIAGSLVAYQLHRQQRSFRVLDAGHDNSASRVAAGMFSPVSGKRKTIDKAFFDRLKLAVETYREIELLLGKSILHLENVYQLFDDETEKELLIGKMLLPEYNDVFMPWVPTMNGINNRLGGITIKHSGWVDCPLFIASFREWLHNGELLIVELFNYEFLQIKSGYFQYDGLQFQNIIFCEGYRAATNPFFNEPIIPCKGDIISIAAGGNTTSGIIKKNAFYLLPAIDGMSKVGATFKWHNSDEALYKTDRHQLEQAASAMLDGAGCKTIQHQSAIRATTPGQQVIAKQHPAIKNMFMLNGLGTKGILIGPWYSTQLAQALPEFKPVN
jgi:glycine/D-amino acid oxidase-like deaminating enzyme